MNFVNVVPTPGTGLSSLNTVTLTPDKQRILDKVAPGATGPEPWRRRQLSAGHELLAIDQITGRTELLFLDLTGPLRAVIRMRVPVPTRRDGTGPLTIAPMAVLGLTLRPEYVSSRQPGTSFFEVLEPRHVYHAHVSPSYMPPGVQILCL